MIGKIISAGVVALAGAATAATAVKRKKNPEFCPICEVRKAIAKTGVHIVADKEYNNGVALTPPMGWSSWNAFRENIDEKQIYDTAKAMKQSGLLEAGYNYVNLDDCWHSSQRDSNGRLQGDLSNFPRGIKPLVEDINDLGFKVGIYSSNGTLTCEDLPASLGYERVDAETFADWGVEYFKYDFCHNKQITSKAPLIDKVIVSSPDGSETIELEAENGELYGTAKTFTDDNGMYIGHLDSGNGSVKFSFVNVKNDGEYIVTIIVRKVELKDKFVTVTINGDEFYPVDVPPTNGWSKFGRVQTVVKLRKGDNTIEIKNPVGSKMDSSAIQYINMGKELKRATKLYAEKNNVPEKPIVYSICEWGFNKPWKWGKEAGNLWRTTLDIRPEWASILAIYEFNVKLYKYSCIGGWNDPDMLEVGNGKLTVDENKTHFTLWCMMAAPLILGNDIRKFIKDDGTVDYSNKILQIVTNKELIAVDQDKLGVQCRRIKTNAISDVLVKPLENDEVAVCFFNKTGDKKNMSVDMAEIVNQTFVNIPASAKYECTDLWSKDETEITTTLSADVSGHGVVVYRIKAITE